MFDGFIKVAAVTPPVKVADCYYNVKKICEEMEAAAVRGAKIIVFPELCITGYTCGDLFGQELLLEEARNGLRQILIQSQGKEAIVFVGLPWEKDGKLYNVAAAVSNGSLLGLIPKKHLPNYAQFYEARHFREGNEIVEWVSFDGMSVAFGIKQLFIAKEIPGLSIAAEICEDLWAPNPPSVEHAMAGATVIVNLSASNEVVGKEVYRKALVSGQSARLLCGYIYSSAGEGESTTDLVFGGHNLIAEDGVILKESERFTSGIIYGEIDIRRLRSERRRITTFVSQGENSYETIGFHMQPEFTELKRHFDSTPFVPKENRDFRCEELIMIQAMGLKKRLEHTGVKHAVIGISGGLDSTLALLVITKTFDMLKIPHEKIIAVTMPCFGTTDRTYINALGLVGKLGATLREIDIKEAVNLHFKDLGHDSSIHDVTYENSQARERTQILMDIANQCGGMVIGTGDMSELALGFATYNGDHMSMYAVNSSVPKTLVRCLVEYYARSKAEGNLRNILLDILATPVSPELLPPEQKEITQRTEDLVGPYELHDFFLYYVLRFGYEPRKIHRIAMLAFEDIYDKDVIVKWMNVFYRRFFSQQFKRSCMPDGPKVGSVALSPRGDLRMPSDACVTIWMKNLEGLI